MSRLTHRKLRCTECGTPVPPGIFIDVCPVLCKPNWESFCEVQGKNYRTPGCPWCAYHFEGEEFRDTRALAAAFARNWDGAIHALRTNSPHEWVSSGGGLIAQAEILQKSAADPALDDDGRVAVAVMALDPFHSFHWRGAPCDERAFVSQPALAVRVIDGRIPHYCELAGAHPWIPQLKQRCEGVKRVLSARLRDPLLTPSLEGILSLATDQPTAAGRLADAMPLLVAHTTLATHKQSQRNEEHKLKRQERLAFRPSPPGRSEKRAEPRPDRRVIPNPEPEIETPREESAPPTANLWQIAVQFWEGPITRTAHRAWQWVQRQTRNLPGKK